MAPNAVSLTVSSSQEDLASTDSSKHFNCSEPSDEADVSLSQLSPTNSYFVTKTPHSTQVCAHPLSWEASSTCPPSNWNHFSSPSFSPKTLPWPDVTLTPLPFGEDDTGGMLYEGMRVIEDAFRRHAGLGSKYYQTSRAAQEKKLQTTFSSMQPLPQVRLPVSLNSSRNASYRDPPDSSRSGISWNSGSRSSGSRSSGSSSDRDKGSSSNGRISFKHNIPSSEFRREEEEEEEEEKKKEGSSLDQPAWIGSTGGGKSPVSTTFHSTHFCNTPYGEGVVLKLQRNDDDMMVVRLHWGSTAYIQAEDVKITRIICMPNVNSLKTSLTDMTRRHHLALLKPQKNGTTSPTTTLQPSATTKAIPAIVPDISTLQQMNYFQELPDTFIVPQLAPLATLETVQNIAFIQEVGEFQIKNSPKGITPIYRKEKEIPPPPPQPSVFMPRDNKDNDFRFRRQGSSLLSENSGKQRLQSMGNDQQRESTSRSESFSLGGATSKSSSSSLHSWHGENQNDERKPLDTSTESYLAAPGIVRPSKYPQSFLPETNPPIVLPSYYSKAAVENGEINHFPQMDNYQSLTFTKQPIKRLQASVIR